MMPDSSRPLVVDLDRSLLRCDLLHDALAGLAIRRPFYIARLAMAHRHKLAAFKSAVARIAPVSPAHLPYIPEVLDFIRAESSRGRRIVLATASPHAWADSIAAHVGLFDDVIASSDRDNLKGARKLSAVRQLLGDTAFDYIGDSMDDVPVFQAATRRILVGSSPAVVKALKQRSLSFSELAPADAGATIRPLRKICRPHHWIKNTLIFLPALTSFGLYEISKTGSLAAAFIAMCLVASAVYIVNDLSDIAADRLHGEKQQRPLATGLITVPAAATLALVLAACGLGIAAFVGTKAFVPLLAYLLINAAYTVRLKELPLGDICALTVFYLLRVVIGIIVLGQPPTFWFLALLACIFTELALWKRYVEVIRSSGCKLVRRGYTTSDASVLLVFGIGFSFSAVLILAMYTHSNEISPLYRTPALLALLAPILLVHNLGMWLDGSRGFTSGDPVMRVIRSKKSWAAVFASAVVIVLARLVRL